MVRQLAKQRLVRLVIGSAVAISLVGCKSDGHKARLTAPFDAKVVVGEVTAAWNATGEERAFAEAIRLKEPQGRFRYRLDIRNQVGRKLFVRLGKFELVDKDGLALGQDDATVECTLSVGGVDGVLAGDVWVAKSRVDKVAGFGLNHFAVPLGGPDRERYRDFRLQGRPAQSAEIDAEIATEAAAPPCASR